MKKIILAVLVAIGAVTAHAQSTVLNNPDNKTYFGIRASLDITCPTDLKQRKASLDIFNPGAGVSFGGIVNTPLGANLYFEPGLTLYYNTYGIDPDLLNISGFNGKISYSIRKFGIRVPFNFGYHFDFTPNTNVFIYTGPMIKVGLIGRLHASAKQGASKVSESESIYGEGGVPRIDVLWNFGAGVNFNHFTISAGGSIGLCNMSGNGDTKYRENLVQLTLGYNF